MRLFPAVLLAALSSFPAMPCLAASPIVDDSKSPHAVLRSVSVADVHMGPGFWTERRKVNAERSLPTMLALEEQNGWIDNFLRLEGKAAPRKGPVYTDSDVYKWIEAAAWQLAAGPNPKLQGDIDRLTEIIGKAQEPSGYLNTYYQGPNQAKRFTEMYRSHELYCLGHLLQAAIAYDRTTGNHKLLEIAIRYADFLVGKFGPGKEPALTGHPELEMALIELYRTTGERKYLDFAGYLLSGVETERLHLTPAQVKYMFSGVPFTSRTAFVGHAVRAMYAASGATDYYMETGDAAYKQTLDRLWNDMAQSKLYITGGVGSRERDEAFGEPYELPNAQAYTESCAAIATFMWNWRMLLATGEEKFAAVMERALYNGINSGMSLEGTLYCYRNPLESNGEKIRNPFYDTDCCPPNLERTFAQLPGYLYATSQDAVWVNFFHSSTFQANGLSISQTTDYPLTGKIDLTVNTEAPVERTLHIRIPDWSARTKLLVNGNEAPVQPGTYAAIKRTWKRGDRVAVTLDIAPRLTSANPLLREDAGRVAVERGPLVYCLEQADQPDLRLFDTAIKSRGAFTEERSNGPLGDIVVLQHEGAESPRPLRGEALYSPYRQEANGGKPVTLKLIPYYAWANRGPGRMEVWLPVQ